VSMFPLKELDHQEPVIVEIPKTSVRSHLLLQPHVGPHVENYTIYRTLNVAPAVLDRMIRRGASLIGLDEDVLGYTIRSIELKLNKWQSGAARGLEENITLISV
jgi:hypothetical protein